MSVASDSVPAVAGKREVWVRSGQRLTPRYVTTGAASGDRTEILDGLTDGEEVAVAMTSTAAVEQMPTAERSPFMPTPPGGGNKKK